MANAEGSDRRGPRDGGGRVRLRDVAARAGVSIGTASNAFNRPGEISDKLRERVLAAAEALGYAGPDPAGRRLRTGRAGAVGLIFTAELTFAFEDQASTQFLAGVARGLQTAETGLLILPTGPEFEGLEGPVRQAVVDGFIVYSSPDDDPRIAAALSRGLPMVAVDEPRRTDMPWIGIDDVAAGRSAAQFLLALGHERIGVMAFEEGRVPGVLGCFDVAVDRLAGYREGLADRFGEELLFRCRPNTSARAREVASEMLALTPRPTAVLAMSDAMAVGTLQAAEDAGIDVPRELSIVGFDGTPQTLTTTPTLTTVAQPQEEKGRLAAAIVAKAVERGGLPRRTRRLLATELIVRGSTGPPPRRRA
jgi:DNA-binding LacI/PurR family transcriptional regulator